MPATFAGGDIHGDSDLLAQLLDDLDEQAAAADRFVFLGDYIDRGPDSRGVIELLIRFQARHPGQTVFLMGNHEQVLLETLQNPTTTGPFFIEGLVTLGSYSVQAEQEITAALRRLGPDIWL